jgi:hypothetical protein
MIELIIRADDPTDMQFKLLQLAQVVTAAVDAPPEPAPEPAPEPKKAKPKAKKPPAPEPKPEPEAEEVNLEMVQERIGQLLDSFGDNDKAKRETLFEILQSVGVKRISHIDAADYPKVLRTVDDKMAALS